MKANLILPNPEIFRVLKISLVIFLIFQTKSFAQKNDYIITEGTIYTEGKIRGLPSENNTVVFFSRGPREDYKRYTVEEVNEFRVNQRKFFKKTIETNGVKKAVYLELLPDELNGAKLWRLNQEKDTFYLGMEEELILLDRSYQTILKNLVANPELNPLIEITHLKWFDISYLFNSAKQYKAPRTYTPLVGFSPFVGFYFAKNQFILPNTNALASVSGTGPMIGFGLEAFLNFKRNFSFNFTPSIATSGMQTFLNYDYGGNNFETDIYMEYSTINLPITTKYYFDLAPNKFRLYMEGGFVLAINDYKKMVMHLAQQEGDVITTFEREFSLESKFNGYTYSIGVERYFNKANGVIFGIKNMHLKTNTSERTFSTTAFAGFKF